MGAKKQKKVYLSVCLSVCLSVTLSLTACQGPEQKAGQNANLTGGSTTNTNQNNITVQLGEKLLELEKLKAAGQDAETIKRLEEEIAKLKAQAGIAASAPVVLPSAPPVAVTPFPTVVPVTPPPPTVSPPTVTPSVLITPTPFVGTCPSGGFQATFTCPPIQTPTPVVTVSPSSSASASASATTSPSPTVSASPSATPTPAVSVTPTPTVTSTPTPLPSNYSNSLGMNFVRIQPGTFTMGSPTNEPGRNIDSTDETQHQVTISQGFYIQTTELTQGQWLAMMGSYPGMTPSSTHGIGSNHPMYYVSWNDAQSFITALNTKGEGTYRLPTEAEWEYTARAGSTTGVPTGELTSTGCSSNPPLDAISWFCGNSGLVSHPVGGKQANAWGLYDMHGNVSEWVQDWYGTYPTGSVTDPSWPW